MFPAGGPNGGHWAAFIQVGDEIVFASLHGRRYLDAAVEMALALADRLDVHPPS
jgi:NADPH-dependent ferric siderophore reductase